MDARFDGRNPPSGARAPLIRLRLEVRLAAQAELTGLRKWTVPGFPNLLIVYLVEGETPSVIHVLHAARDWMRHLETN